MEFNEVIKDRFACKDYSSAPVEPEKLQAVLEAGRLAPTAKNFQEQCIYVLQSEEALRKVDELTPCRYHAPIVLLVAYDTNSVYTYPGSERTSGIEDATIVATHMMLAATNEGLDNCWVNNFNPEQAAKTFDLPENQEVLMMLDLGYAAEGAGPLPNHFDRAALDETVTYL